MQDLNSKSLSLTIDKNGIANLTFDLPGEKINKLSSEVLHELEIAVNVIDGNKGIRALILTSNKDDIFIAGADINEIKDITEEKDAEQKVGRGQEIITKIAKLKIPTIALIKGACMGGGLELALACDYRLVVEDEKTILGLPEVNLGIIPGFGGTQRLPALLGLQESLKMILSGKAVDAKKSYRIGLCDKIIRDNNIEEGVSNFISKILKDEKNNIYLAKRKSARRKRSVIENILCARFLIYYMAQKDLYNKTKGNYIAPFYALEVVKRTYNKGYVSKGLKIELKAFCELVVGDISKNMIEIFFTNEALKKDNGVDGKFEIKEINNSIVLGAGIMGGGIAWLLANKDINVRIKDISNEAIALGYQQILKIFNQLKKIRKIKPAGISNKITKVSSSLDYSGFNNADLVIEAAVENIEIKKKILAELENEVRGDTIIASNTSSLSISQMSKALKDPKRFAGMHFFNPVNRMPLVEVIKGEETSDETIANIVALSKKLKKTPIVVKDVSGFLVNRILLPFMNEAAYLLQDGQTIERIDSEIEKFGMPMGPFTLADVVGIDVGVKVANSLYESYGERMKVSEILNEINNNKELLGKKSKKGFYLYPSKKVNPEIYEILDKVRKDNNIHTTHITQETIIDRCILTFVNEAAKCLEEGVVKNARYLDMAMIMGAGFPAFKGGVLRYADKVGISNVVDKLSKLNKIHGKRFEVSKLLIEMSQKKQKFYD